MTTFKRPALSLLALALSLATAFSTAPAIAQTDAVADRWDLTKLYQDDAAFDADARQLDAQLKQLASCRGQLGASSARLKSCLDLYA